MLPSSESSSVPRSRVLDSFIYALKTVGSQREYPGRLKKLFIHLGLAGTLEEQATAFLQLAKQNDSQWLQDTIISFINHHKQRVQRKELSAGTLHNYYCAVKLFCEMNNLDTAINWKRISRGLPRSKTTANDRAPTIEEIRKLVEYTDRRVKAIVYTMCSTGIRLGSWYDEVTGEYLRWKHVIPQTNAEYLRWKKQQEIQEKGHSNIVITREDEEKIIAAKLLVYAGEPEEYYTFMTPEAYNELKKYMDFRKSMGEKIDGDSPLIRDKLPESTMKYGAKWGLATYPKPLHEDGIKKVLYRAIWSQGLRQPLLEGKRRHEWKLSHGFRKFYKTRTEQVMRPLNIELLLSHESGMSDYYYRPTEKEVLNDYVKAVEYLTISDHYGVKTTLNTLKEQLAAKQKEDDYKNYVIAQTNKELQVLKDKFTSIEQKHGKMLDSWERTGQRLDKIISDSADKRRKHQDNNSSKKKNWYLSFADDEEAMIASFLKKEADEARELRKELHS
jgi:hypothetical protein